MPEGMEAATAVRADPGELPPRVTVAVATFRRTERLRPVLDELTGQVQRCGFTARVLVIDNNPIPEAADLVRSYPAAYVRYAHEPAPGIAAARNRALDECQGEDAVVFIDDDEIPGPGWLATLVNAWQTWGCAAVAGPVVSVFETAPDTWVAGSGVFDRQRAVTGSLRRGAATNNLLLDIRWLTRSGLRFDERFGLTGGSDTMLTHTMVSLGADIRWCDEAEVTEVVPAQRTTRRWVISRTIRTSNDWSRVHLLLAGGPRSRLAERCDLVIRGMVRMARGAAASALGLLVGGPRLRARGECSLASGYGMITGAVGRIRSEYARG
jgi:glycosyltransferase involved in cell wall biosynthesis